MRNWKIAAITGSLTMAALTPTAFASTHTQSYVETNHGWVSYHSAATLSSSIVGRLQLGDKAPLVKQANAYWYEIQWNGKDVYITTNRTYTHVVQETTGTTTTAPTTKTPTTTTQTRTPSPAASTTPAPSSATAASTVQYVETMNGWVSYHSQASIKSPVVGRLLLGDKAPLVKQANAYWYEIQWNGQTVYITTNSKYTHIVTETANTSAGTSSSSSPVLTGTSPVTSSASGSAPTSSASSTGTSPVTGSTKTGSSASGTTGTSTTSEPAWQQEADKVIATAKTQLGVPYLWGKQEPGIGFDCSNFTAWSFRTALGISFSGSSVTQRNSVGTPVALSNIREGDLLFFKTANNPTGGGHVGIYMGNGMVIQEGGGWKKVAIEPLKGTWLGTNLVFARRVIN